MNADKTDLPYCSQESQFLFSGSLNRKLCHIEYLFMEIGQNNRKKSIYRPKYKY